MKTLFILLFFLNFLNISEEDGLSSNKVLRVYQTSDGVMWFGTTKGMTSYDGNHFHAYMSIDGDTTSLSDNVVTSFVEDNDGRHLWVGTMHGLCRMDMAGGVFERIEPKESLQADAIRALMKDSQGRLWTLGSDDNYLYVSVLDSEGQPVCKRAFDSVKEGDYYYFSLLEDGYGKIWAMGRMGRRCKMTLKDGQLFKEVDYQGKHVLSSGFLSEEGEVIASTSDGIVSFGHDGKSYDVISARDSSSIAMAMDRKGNFYSAASDRLNYYTKVSKYILNKSEKVPGNILTLFIDRDENLWIGTDKGVFMSSPIKGYIRHFSTDAELPQNRISSNSVTALMLDRDSTLWVGSEQNGVDTINLNTGAKGNIKYTLLTPQLDAKTAQKEAVTLDRYRIHSLKGLRNENHVSTLYQDSRGTVYIGLWSHVGFNTFDKRTKELRRHCLWGFGPPNSWIYHVPIPTNAFGANWYAGFLEDSKGRMWAATWEGYGLNLFDRKSGEFAYKHYLQRNNPDKNNSASCLKLYLDRRLQRLYVGGGHYYGYYDLQKREFFRYVVDYPPFFEMKSVLQGYLDNSPNLLSTGIKVQNALAAIYLHNDSYGNNYLTTDVGLIRHSLEDDRFTVAIEDFHNSPSSMNNPSDFGDDFYYIRDHTMCRYSMAEGSQTELPSEGLKGIHFPESEYKHLISDAGNGRLLIGLTVPGQGLFSFDTRTGAVDSIPFFNKKSIRHIIKDAQGRLYVSTEEGAYMMDADGTPHELTSDHTAKTYIEEDKIWLCTHKGLLIINRNDSTRTVYRNDGSAPGQPCSNAIEDVLRYDDSTLFVSTVTSVEVFNENTGIFTDLSRPDKHSLTSRLSSCVIESSKGDIWYGTTQEGLSILNIASDTIRSYRHHPYDTTSIPDDCVTDIHEDAQGNIWVGTVRGLCHYDPSGQRFRRTPHFAGKDIRRILSDSDGMLWVSTAEGLYMYDAATSSLRAFHRYLGFQGEEYTTAACTFPDGHIALGGNGGFDIFLPSEVNSDPAPRPIVVSGLPCGEGDAEEGIVLRHKDNTIAFEISSTDYAFAPQIRYRYRLRGFETQWSYTEPPQLSLKYTNIPSGRFVIEIEATNRFGEWCGVLREIPLRIQAPLMARWYFLILYVALFVLGMWLVIKLRERKMMAEKMALEKIVKERTAELAHEVDSRNRFFSIISHDLKNPVAAIGMLSEVLSQQYAALNDDKRKEVIDTIHESYTHAMDLINTIVLWASSQRKVIKPVIAKVDIHEVCEEIIGLNSVNLSAKEIAISNEVPERFVLDTDRNMVSAILRNLVSNAIKFSYRDGRIILSASIPSPGNFTISVSDTGTGMTPQIRDSLFRLDTKIHTQGTGSEQGLGLGLIIVKEFLDRLGWDITVESEVGKGSQFIIGGRI